MTLFELLHQSHDIQRSLCRRLTATRGNSAQRELLFLQLKIELEAHAAAEERFVYCPILLTDAGLSVSRHALAEHHDIEEYCEDLSVRGKGGDEWLATARSIFPLADKASDEPTADLLTQRLTVHEQTAWMLRSLLEN